MPTLLPGTVKKSEARLGFDTTYRLTDLAPVFYGSGFRFAVRYISRSKFVSKETHGSGSLSRMEAEKILAAGLALMPVQFAKTGLIPSHGVGEAAGEAAAHNATELGFPVGCTVWCDVEAIHEDASALQVVGYVNAWHEAVTKAGFRPGIYVDPDSRLTRDELFSKLYMTSYWKSASWVDNVDTRGYQMVQSLSQKIHGIYVDFDIAAIDSLKGRPYWLDPGKPKMQDDKQDSLFYALSRLAPAAEELEDESVNKLVTDPFPSE